MYHKNPITDIHTCLYWHDNKIINIYYIYYNRDVRLACQWAVDFNLSDCNPAYIVSDDLLVIKNQSLKYDYGVIFYTY